jgi:hypothetical protein
LRVSAIRVQYLPTNDAKSADRCKSCSNGVQKGDMAHHGRAQQVVVGRGSEFSPKSVRICFEMVRAGRRMRRGGATGPPED